jgi:hypothetical protein
MLRLLSDVFIEITFTNDFEKYSENARISVFSVGVIVTNIINLVFWARSWLCGYRINCDWNGHET